MSFSINGFAINSNKVYDNSPATALRINIIFISCKQEENEFVLPVFTVFVGSDEKGADRRNYIDTQCRIYKDWEDWKNNNSLPMLKYAYPERGFYSCSGSWSYEFDEKRDPDIGYGTSPQCDVSSRIFRQTDNASALVSLGLFWFYSFYIYVYFEVMNNFSSLL